MKRRDVAVMIGALTAVGTASAQFGGLLGGSRGGGGGASVDAIVADFVILAKACGVCALQLGYAFATREQAAEFQAKAKSFQAISTPKELGAAFNDVSKSTEATVQSLSDSAKAAEAYSKLSPEMQKFVVMALATAGIGALKVVDIVRKVQSVTPTPMDAPKLLVLKDPLQIIGKTMPIVWDRGLGMLKTANVSPPKPDKDAKLEASADGWPENTSTVAS
jgi:hypothetical protein